MEFGKIYKNWLYRISEQPAVNNEEHDLDMVWAGIEEEIILDEAWTGIDALLDPLPATIGNMNSNWNGFFSRSGFVIFTFSVLLSFILLWQSDSSVQPQDESLVNGAEISSVQSRDINQTESIQKAGSSLNSMSTPVAPVKNEPLESVKLSDSFNTSRADVAKPVMEEVIIGSKEIDMQESLGPPGGISGTQGNINTTNFSDFTITPPGNSLTDERVIPSGLIAAEEDSPGAGEKVQMDVKKSSTLSSAKGWEIPRSLLHFEVPVIEFAQGSNYTFRLRKWRWHGAGISISYNNSWIMNNETLSGLNRSSLNNTRFSYAPEIGFSTVFASPRDYRLEMELFVLSEQSQRMNQYINALYQERKLSLHYHKAHLSWQMPLGFAPGKIGIGGYYAILDRAEEIIAGKIRRMDEFYTKQDYGFTFQYKLEYKLFSGLVLTPSLRAQYSLHNIFNGNEVVPGFLRKTHNAAMGINLGLYYRF